MTLAARLGLIDPPGLSVDTRPGVLLHGAAAAIECAWPAADAALRLRSDYRLVIAVPARDLDRLQRRFSHERVVELPAFSPIGRVLWQRRLGIVLALDAGLAEQVIAETIRGLPERRAAGQGIGDVVARLLISATRTRRLKSVAPLQSALGLPKTILCLGNGPTSEDPALDTFTGATLFRVNWTWRGRGRWTRPDAVFTADPDLPPPELRPVLVFPDARTGRRILMHHLLEGRGPRRGYAFADALLPPVDPDARESPTNGALMVAVAAALAPEMLVIAGMDLYRHPAGRYPGSDAVEGYARGHSARCDLAMIAGALDRFEGRIVLLSPNLAGALGR